MVVADQRIDTVLARGRSTPDIDVAVIGGGIVGLMSAFFLAREGLKVAVYDKSGFFAEQSSRNWGWCRTFGRDLRELDLASRALRLWRELAAMLGGPTGFSACGITYLADDGDAARYQAYRRAFPQSGSVSRIIPGRLVGEHLPGISGRWDHAISVPADGIADPHMLGTSLVAALRAIGVHLYPRTAITGIETAAGRVTAVHCGDRTARCGAVVLACGAWSGRMLRAHGIRLPQAMVVSSVMNVVPRAPVPKACVFGPGFAFGPAGAGRYRIAHGGRSILPLSPENLRAYRHFLPGLRAEWRFLKRYLTPRFDTIARGDWADTLRGLLHGGSGRRMRELDPPPDRTIMEDALNNLATAFPAFRDAGIERRWAGVIDASPDGLPVISGHEAVCGLVVATGFSGHGFGLAPATGELVADIVVGRRPRIDAGIFGFDRLTRHGGTTVGMRM